ncbi:MAG: DNA-directed RNA polymerase subunit L [Methanosarcina sp.]|jgi:DNA-directed RNA polymerase subunit L|nr:DNA-directed RNA polymerase subunit L [Methanosarcina sp.]MDD3316349.1 DNA-directed RNA polymerase subunit L [Methanosarcina sp.]MDD4306018.1 DNA-directed RNA polymerase subunit L [Methanosarcina sp.]MDD4619889.1 DNA-directed RNA polymerase subunit L [Methanosarcina sp.]NLN43743.1 DNA-directed RNA polymerase subunit L [Methanosarcina sp.]
MELNILSKTDNELEVELKGETHTLLNILKEILVKDERVEVVFYDMKYVSISEPILYIKTDGTNPIQVLKDAASNIITQCDEFTDVFSKAVNA